MYHCNIFSGDQNHNMSHFDISSEISLSRYKRANALSSITNLINLIGIDSNNKTILDSFNLIALLTEQKDLCPMEKLSINLIIKMMLHPKILFCFVFNTIKQNEFFSKFLFKIFLPGLHWVLNLIEKTLSNYRLQIEIFNTLYNILKIFGYIN